MPFSSSVRASFLFFFFFFNDTATTEIYTLSLHDALPISARTARLRPARQGAAQRRARSIRERHARYGRPRRSTPPRGRTGGQARRLFGRARSQRPAARGPRGQEARARRAATRGRRSVARVVARRRRRPPR